MIGPTKGFNDRFEDDVQEEDPAEKSKKTERKYDTCTLRDERKVKDEQSRCGNKSTDDDDWS